LSRTSFDVVAHQPPLWGVTSENSRSITYTVARSRPDSHSWDRPHPHYGFFPHPGEHLHRDIEEVEDLAGGVA